MDRMLTPEMQSINQRVNYRASSQNRESGSINPTPKSHSASSNSNSTTPEVHINKVQDVAESVNESFEQTSHKCKESHEIIVKSMLNTNIGFKIDENNNSSYIEITNKATNELLRTIPSEAMRNILEKIDKHIDEILSENFEDNKGILLDTNS